MLAAAGFLLLIVTYTALPLLLSAWLQHLLVKQGFTQVNVELGYPDLQAIDIRSLQLSGTASDRVFDFKARDIEIQYRLGDLPRGRLQALRIPDSALHVTSAPDDPVAAPQPLAVPLPHEWLRAFPLQDLVVEKMLIDWRTDDIERRATLSGRAQHLEDTFLSRWTLTDTQPYLEFELAMAQDGTLNAALFRPSAPTKPLVSANVRVVPQDNQTVAIRGSFDAQLKSMETLLSLWLPKSMLPIDGRLQAQWHGIAPAVLPVQTAGITRGAAFNGVLQIDASQLQLGEFLQSTNLHLKSRLATDDKSLQWRLEDAAHFSARLDPSLLAFGRSAKTQAAAQTLKPTTIRVARGFSGELLFQAPDWHLLLPAQSRIRIEHLQTPDAQVASLDLILRETARIIYQTQSGQWKTQGLAFKVSAPTVQPQLTGFGAIENLTLTAKLEAGLLSQLSGVRIEDAELFMLGGRISGRRIHYDSARATSPFTLEIKHLDLARVVALEQQQQIEASGRLDGTLPFILSRTGIVIVEGQLKSDPDGGVIRYHATDSIQAMAATNSNLKLALQAFSNYRYQKLNVGVNYAQNGDLALAVTVAGRNPDFNAGQPINLNINISENIPSLLRSLRSSDEIGEKFQNRAKQRTPTPPR